MVAIETVREILAAHSSGISRPGLLAWARLRIDTAMTEAQLEEELARLGDEVVDDAGFLYLRGMRSPAPSSPSAWAPASRASDAYQPAPTVTAWTPLPRAARRGFGGIGKALGVGVFLWWLISFVGGFSGDRGGDASAPTRPAAPTPTGGTVIGGEELAVGDCIVVPTEDVFYEIRTVPCDTPHGGEVFLTIEYTSADFPSDDALRSFAEGACVPVFESWTGTALDEQDLLDITYFSPTETSWQMGDRTIQCYLYLVDGSPAEQSYRGSNP